MMTVAAHAARLDWLLVRSRCPSTDCWPLLSARLYAPVTVTTHATTLLDWDVQQAPPGICNRDSKLSSMSGWTMMPQVVAYGR